MKRKQMWVDEDFELALEEFRKRVSKQMGTDISKRAATQILGKSIVNLNLLENATVKPIPKNGRPKKRTKKGEEVSVRFNIRV